MKLPVSEVYQAYQGEGPHAGKPVVFIRTQGCPVGCVWCDSKFTWEMAPKLRGVEPANLIKNIPHLAPRHVVITGGEPLIHHKPLLELVKLLIREGYKVDFETSGTYPPLPMLHHHNVFYVVSPKPPSAKTKIPVKKETIELFREQRHCFKFVISGPDDLDWASSFIKDYDIPERYVWLMPEGETQEKLQVKLKRLIIDAPNYLPGANITTRMHIQAFGQKRGV